MKKYSRVCARINLDAIEANMEHMKSNIKKETKIIAVIKADGYGHGAVPIAKMLVEKEYIWGFATASFDEAMVLKKNDIQKPVLVLGCTFKEQREALAANEIRMTVYTEEMAEDISQIGVALGKEVYVHIKLDTGMGRIGFCVNETSAEAIDRISKLPNLILEGLYTHFARADEVDKECTKKQMERYLWMKQELAQKEVTFANYHCSNSAGIIDIEAANMDLVRAGIASYGLYPSEEVEKERVLLTPALELVSHVIHVKWVEEGTPISYGGTHVTKRKTKVATIPVGYADGYPRSLSDKGYVLIHGKKAPILGRVCMDQFMADVTEIESVAFGDVVTLVGRNEEAFLPVEVLSDISGRFNYEFVCDIGKRVPREYIRHGEVIGQNDYFE